MFITMFLTHIPPIEPCCGREGGDKGTSLYIVDLIMAMYVRNTCSDMWVLVAL